MIQPHFLMSPHEDYHNRITVKSTLTRRKACWCTFGMFNVKFRNTYHHAHTQLQFVINYVSACCLLLHHTNRDYSTAFESTLVVESTTAALVDLRRSSSKLIMSYTSFSDSVS